MESLKILLIGIDKLSSEVQAYTEKLPFLVTVATCNTIKEAHKLLQKADFNLLILYVDSHDLADYHLLSSQITVPFIVVSPSKEFAADAYEAGAKDYLLTPFDYERFQKAMIRAADIKSTPKSISFQKKLVIKAGRRAEIIPFDQIQYVEAYGTFAKIHKTSGAVVTVSEMLGWVMGQLPESLFLRVHKSYIVNIEKITSFDKRVIYIDNKSFEIGVTYKSKLASMLSILDKE